MSDTKYNGWTNYETWLVALWIDNDQGLQETVCELARECVKHPTPNQFAEGGFLSPAYTLEGQLKELVQDEDNNPTKGLLADLLNAAFSRVDWREVCNHFIEYVQEEAA